MPTSILWLTLVAFAWILVALLGLLFPFHAIQRVLMHGKVSKISSELAGPTLAEAKVLALLPTPALFFNDIDDDRAVWSKLQFLAATAIIYRHDQNLDATALEEQIVAIDVCLCQWHSTCWISSWNHSTLAIQRQHCKELRPATGMEITIDETKTMQAISSWMWAPFMTCDRLWLWPEVLWKRWSSIGNHWKTYLDHLFEVDMCLQFPVKRRRLILSVLINKVEATIQRQIERVRSRSMDLVRIQYELEVQAQTQIPRYIIQADHMQHMFPFGKAEVHAQCMDLLQSSNFTISKLLEEDARVSRLLAQVKPSHEIFGKGK